MWSVKNNFHVSDRILCADWLWEKLILSVLALSRKILPINSSPVFDFAWWEKMTIYQSCHSLLLFFRPRSPRPLRPFEKAKNLEGRKRCRGTTTTAGPATEGTMQGTEVTQTTAKTNSSQPMGKHACTSTNCYQTKLQTNYVFLIIPLFLRIQQKQHHSKWHCFDLEARHCSPKHSLNICFNC